MLYTGNNVNKTIGKWNRNKLQSQEQEINKFHSGEPEPASVKGLYQALTEYADMDFYPYHMPGHKRNPQAGEMAGYYRFDITEIDGFDNLHHAEGIIKEAEQRAGRLYGAEETHYLVNGSTCGVLASILAVTGQGDEILIARNCHKSVYHAAIMQGLTLHYYYPKVMKEYDIYDGVDVQEITKLLDTYPNCKAVVITSPTYEGILSDVRAIAQAVHEKGKILIVDEAHGAHLKEGAVAGGADLVIHSLHKTLPAMTQTALLHVSGERVDRRKLRKFLTMLQTSSPSYVMMASMDSCIRYMEQNGQERLDFYRKQYDVFMKKIGVCKYIHVGKMTDVSYNAQFSNDRSHDSKLYKVKLDNSKICHRKTSLSSGEKYSLTGWDIGKLVISVKGTSMTGQQLYDTLRDEYHLQMEMASATYVLAMMTIMDTEEGWQRLADAIVQIDDRIEEGITTDIYEESASPNNLESQKTVRRTGEKKIEAEKTEPEIRMTPARAFYSSQEEVPLDESVGQTMADFIYLYPPGIPLLVPGEVMSEALLQEIQDSIRMGLQVHGITDAGNIPVIVPDVDAC